MSVGLYNFLCKGKKLYFELMFILIYTSYKIRLSCRYKEIVIACREYIYNKNKHKN